MKIFGTEPNKVECCECGSRFDRSRILHAPNPFDLTDTIHGCPECLCVASFHTLCDEAGCEQWYSIGTPIPGGYRMTCHIHAPKG